jgi:hypothetical protein
MALIALLATSDAFEEHDETLYTGVIVLTSIAALVDIVSLFSFYIKSACTLFITLFVFEQLLIVGYLICFLDLMLRRIDLGLTEHILVGFTVVLYIVFHFILNR